MAARCTLCLSLLLFLTFSSVSFSLSEFEDKYYRYPSADSQIRSLNNHEIILRLRRSATDDDDDDDDSITLNTTNKEVKPIVEDTTPIIKDNITVKAPVTKKPSIKATTEETTVTPSSEPPGTTEAPLKNNTSSDRDGEIEGEDNITAGFKPIHEDPDTVNDPDSGNDSFTPVEELNSTSTKVDHHRYYKSVTYLGEKKMNEYWVDLDKMKDQVTTNEMLSNAYRRAATVKLNFDFPFYGHPLKEITIATGGFLFTGHYVHTWLAATQYIAPLMANFDTSSSENATIKYADNGTALTVQWSNVPLKDHNFINATFSFQVTLHKSGDIVFVYKSVPVTIDQISDKDHPVKVGISDAYIVDRIIFYIRRKTIYEYHKIDLKKDSVIQNYTTIVFKALPTCVSMSTCSDCLSNIIPFPCYWCNVKQLCSSGLDRNRQDWIQSGCDTFNTDSQEDCASLPPPPTSTSTTTSAPSTTEPPGTVETFGKGASVEPHTGDHSPSPPSGPNMPEGKEHIEDQHKTNRIVSDGLSGDAMAVKDSGPEDPVRTSTNMGAVVGTVFTVALLLALVGWVTYAYFFPHTPSGQFLIRNRPSMWSMRRGEARYTPAAIHSIHM